MNKAIQRNAADAATHQLDCGGSQHRAWQDYIRAAYGADLYEPDRHGVFASLGPSDQEAFGTLAPKVIDNDVYTGCKLLLEAVLQCYFVLDEWDRHIGTQSRESVGVAAGCDDFFCPKMFGDLD